MPLSIADQIYQVFLLSFAVVLGSIISYALMKLDAKRTLKNLKNSEEAKTAKQILNKTDEALTLLTKVLRQMQEPNLENNNINEEEEPSLPKATNYLQKRA